MAKILKRETHIALRPMAYSIGFFYALKGMEIIVDRHIFTLNLKNYYNVIVYPMFVPDLVSIPIDLNLPEPASAPSAGLH